MPTPTSPTTLHRSNHAQARSRPSSPSPPPARLPPSHSSTSTRSLPATKSRPQPAIKEGAVPLPLSPSSPNADQSSPTSFAFGGLPSPSQVSPPELNLTASINAGAKRRHAVMMMLDPPGQAVGMTQGNTAGLDVTGAAVGHGHGQPHGHGHGHGSRRRTRSSRGGLNANQNVVNVGHGHGAAASQDAMDVEEEGRERKRVARR
ncbi:hypothetical protein BDV98DRAFT_576917 [Pterulicium gracile]|uniref:Uncharacterized protein n=1 Tax=Pterulicium gracile TaxID=1884261 RepID=A0A5C3Q1H1_9AGAR|nr:hypothetical protein BDV98DRAFT_576917 [Pterula gracilis]